MPTDSSAWGRRCSPRLGVLYRSAFDLSDYVRPVLGAEEEQAEETGETSCFYIREGTGREYCLYGPNASRTVRSHVEEGTGLPLEPEPAGCR